MKPLRHQPISPRLPIGRKLAAQAGLSLVTAIFLVVTLAALSGVIVNLFITQQQSAALDVVGVRAYQAARAGIEWGLYQQLRLNSCAATTTVAMPAGTTLSNFTVIVKCTRLGDAGPNGISQSQTATTTANDATLRNIADTTHLVEGMRVYGPNIGPGTVIASVDGAATVTMSTRALATSAQPVNISFYSPLDQWELIAIACNIQTGGGCSNAGRNPDYVQRQMQVRF